MSANFLQTLSPPSESMREALKENAINIADDHRAHCHESCNISLVLLAELLIAAGVELTPEELKHFFM